jgi:hypothetical protein
MAGAGDDSTVEAGLFSLLTTLSARIKAQANAAKGEFTGAGLEENDSQRYVGVQSKSDMYVCLEAFEKGATTTGPPLMARVAFYKGPVKVWRRLG